MITAFVEHILTAGVTEEVYKEVYINNSNRRNVKKKINMKAVQINVGLKADCSLVESLINLISKFGQNAFNYNGVTLPVCYFQSKMNIVDLKNVVQK